MNIWNGITSYPADAPAAVATIGNYDGVHLGHRAILRRVVDDAARRGAPSLIVTFSPHPASVVVPDRPQHLLQTRGQKLESLRQAGLHGVLVVDFTPALAALGGDAFFDRTLAGRVRFAAIHVGENFRFGHRREGDLALLARIGERHGFTVHGVSPVSAAGRVVSSTAIRSALAEGDVALARRMLGRPYVVSGEVVHGDGRGRRLDCPTANLEPANEVLPRPGVYVTETTVIAARFPSVTNVGVRPTFGGDHLVIETHLLEFDDDLYHETLEVHFLDRLRDELRFDGVQSLADQLARDRAAAAAYFQNQTLGAS
jgi:riboflavin kinase/FMN adenylyltransferase